MTSLLAFEVRGACFACPWPGPAPSPGELARRRVGAVQLLMWLGGFKCGGLSLGWMVRHVILVRKVQHQWRAVDDIRAGQWRETSWNRPPCARIDCQNDSIKGIIDI